MTKDVQLHDVRDFWQAHPVAAAANPHPLGSVEYFKYYDRLREVNEPVPFSERLHEYTKFGGQHVLDVGSGNGYVLSRYSLAGAKTFGIDLTRTAIDLCRRRFELQGLRGNFLLANAGRTSVPDGNVRLCLLYGRVAPYTRYHSCPRGNPPSPETRRHLILMLYHRNSLLFRVKFPIVRALTGRTIEQQVNEVDGLGNPKGAVYSKRELVGLLDGFADLEAFAGVLPWNKLRSLGRIVPTGVREWCDWHAGWFLYAKARRS